MFGLYSVKSVYGSYFRYLESVCKTTTKIVVFLGNMASINVHEIQTVLHTAIDTTYIFYLHTTTILPDILLS